MGIELWGCSARSGLETQLLHGPEVPEGAADFRLSR
jgi:hypothetical protein